MRAWEGGGGGGMCVCVRACVRACVCMCVTRSLSLLGSNLAERYLGTREGKTGSSVSNTFFADSRDIAKDY